ncbi:MAG: T9SS type A sorting domain-containing protein [candidate division KSB1 bacterium]|nr:T9SS type A sorting domain-containing protein [candidate division KSB1 bacterium]
MRLSKLFILLFILSAFGWTQHAVKFSVFGNGGAALTGSRRLQGTLGQPIVGRGSGEVHAVASGFWPQTGAVLSALSSLGDVPQAFRLDQNFPNPFNQSTTIVFAMPKAGLVSLRVYDLLGREAATLVNSFLDAGEYKLVWEAPLLPSGVYLYRLESGDCVQVRKLVLLK